MYADAAQVVEGVTAEVLDTAGGWSLGSGVRERIYRAKQRGAVLAKAAELRRHVRSLGLEKTVSDVEKMESDRGSGG